MVSQPWSNKSNSSKGTNINKLKLAVSNGNFQVAYSPAIGNECSNPANVASMGHH